MKKLSAARSPKKKSINDEEESSCFVDEDTLYFVSSVDELEITNNFTESIKDFRSSNSFNYYE